MTKTIIDRRGFIAGAATVAGLSGATSATAATHGQNWDRESLVAWAEEAQHNASWIDALGGDPFVTLRGWYDVPGAEDFQSWQSRPDTTGV